MLTSQLHPFLTSGLRSCLLCYAHVHRHVSSIQKARIDSSIRKAANAKYSRVGPLPSAVQTGIVPVRIRKYSYCDRLVCTQIIYGDMFVVERVWTLFSLKCLLPQTRTGTYMRVQVPVYILSAYKCTSTFIRTYGHTSVHTNLNACKNLLTYLSTFS